ncbi:DUF6082 family protein [Streptomyces murinus]|uniref:DUF6082 family protein n=1 Tax=Streptomyces murinus TaxID=33900 RepID=UPI0038066D7C
MKSPQTTALFALASVAAAHLVQRELHQRQNNHIVLAGRQSKWLTDMTTHPDLAEPWVPDGMDIKEYVRLLNANRQICTLSLWHRLGLARGQKLRVLASVLMENDAVRTYWTRFGGLRADEAAADRIQQKFNAVMHDAFVARPQTEPVGV